MFSSIRTVAEASRLLRSGEVTSVELTSACLERIDQVDGDIRAFLTVTADIALMEAQQADDRIASGQGGALTGVPMALKDILSTRGTRTTCGSRMLAEYVPQFDATVVRRLREAGAVLLGKTNMDEFAMGSSTENSAFYATRNPWDLARVPGGSSGGSAAAVASGEALFALGTDTGGSIRQPAALTGTVGLKPTYGRVSRYGLVAFASSLDQIGPIARTAEDAALVLHAIAGHDLLDSTSLAEPVPDYLAHLTGDIRGLRLGVPTEWMDDNLDADMAGVVTDALDAFRELGATAIPVSLPHTQHALSTYYIIAPAEAMANLARYDGVRYGLSVGGDDVWEMFARTREQGFGREVKRRILLGTYALSSGYYDAYYVKAQQVRTLVRSDFEQAFKQVDLLIAPTTPGTAFPLGERVSDPLAMYLSDVFTVPANIAGVPAVSLPGGLRGGLPLGIQLLGPALGEPALLRVADAFQRVTQHHLAAPALERVA